MTLKTVDVNKRVEMLTEGVAIKEEVEEYEATTAETTLVIKTLQTQDDKDDVTDVKVEEVNFIFKDEIA